MIDVIDEREEKLSRNSGEFLLAARRMGELAAAVPPKISGKMAHEKEVSEIRTPAFPDKQRLSEFRKLAAIPPYQDQGALEIVALRRF